MPVEWIGHRLRERAYPGEQAGFSAFSLMTAAPRSSAWTAIRRSRPRLRCRTGFRAECPPRTARRKAICALGSTSEKDWPIPVLGAERLPTGCRIPLGKGLVREPADVRLLSVDAMYGVV